MAGSVQFGSRAQMNWCIIPSTAPVANDASLCCGYEIVEKLFGLLFHGRHHGSGGRVSGRSRAGGEDLLAHLVVGSAVLDTRAGALIVGDVALSTSRRAAAALSDKGSVPTLAA